MRSNWLSFLSSFLAVFCLLNLAHCQCQTSFQLYAYGEGIGGLPVFYADGNAQIGNQSLSNSTEVVSIYCTIDLDSPKVWRALPNMTESPDARFESMIFNLPTLSGSSGGNVGFADPDDLARLDTKPLTLYGNFVLIDSTNANFFGSRAGADGVYNLGWNAAEQADDHRVSLTLRTVPPSTDSVLAGGFNPVPGEDEL
ncbi:hypothetical protein FE257_003046 [Aspergillus nanangensis]|uniref:Uncharacterized protein n=1 Tax=Aspergillus nanangensis TaxID=2582783 RepID=A0AAD4GPT8_ASPNN|nr:hypothetical protein FE257_003046 [Aspergillus nanangensis]